MDGTEAARTDVSGWPPDGEDRVYDRVMDVLRRITSVVAVSVTGTVLVAAGVVMLFIPGPGLLAIAAGLAVWAREFAWARRLLDRGRHAIARRLGRRPHQLPLAGATDDRDLEQAA